MRIPHPAKAFSLIELLVALSILAIIAAIIIPRFIGVQEQAIQAVVMANQSTLNSLYAPWADCGGLFSWQNPTDNPSSTNPAPSSGTFPGQIPPTYSTTYGVATAMAGAFILQMISSGSNKSSQTANRDGPYQVTATDGLQPLRVSGWTLIGVIGGGSNPWDDLSGNNGATNNNVTVYNDGFQCWTCNPDGTHDLWRFDINSQTFFFDRRKNPDPAVSGDPCYGPVIYSSMPPGCTAPTSP